MNKPVKIETETLASSMAAAFAEIEAATKSANNPHFKSKYADLGAVIDAVKPALIKHGLFFTQRPLPSENGVTVETFLHHSGGDSLSLGTLFVPADRTSAQAYGSALTYARRYGLMTAFGVPSEDDDGNAASSGGLAPAQNNHKAKQANDRDAPFPPGPCKNKTALKDAGRALWRDVLACGDQDTFIALLDSHKPLIAQLKEGLPQWWHGGTRDGEPYEGLGQVIERLERDFAGCAEAGMDWRGNVLHAG
jgi:hypothetical protein